MEVDDHRDGMRTKSIHGRLDRHITSLEDH